jgi:hypothetical protein
MKKAALKDTGIFIKGETTRPDLTHKEGAR